jgi:hypothetical protein
MGRGIDSKMEERTPPPLGRPEPLQGGGVHQLGVVQVHHEVMVAQEVSS